MSSPVQIVRGFTGTQTRKPVGKGMSHQTMEEDAASVYGYSMSTVREIVAGQEVATSVYTGYPVHDEQTVRE